jgi:kynureninase
MNALASHYSRFRVAERCLLTGHSHQAWPDVAFGAQQRAWLDAAELVDDKWDEAARQALAVRKGFARLLNDAADRIALGQNTHELVTRWLSALPLRTRPRIVTTDGEFHSARRQLDRLSEEGLDIVTVAARPADGLAERLVMAVNDRTAGVLVSSVLYETAEIVPGLGDVARACTHFGASLLVDAYHHLNVVPFDVETMGLRDACVTGGGYKYCQLGEGNAFLRVPPGCSMRPVLTGWFAELTQIDTSRHSDAGGQASVLYGPGAAAFAGATYDPVSHYRAAAVFAFHREQGLTPDRLRAVSRRQVGLLESRVRSLDLDPRLAHVEPMPDDRRGGFLAVRARGARNLVGRLRGRGIFVDTRGDILRLGPAPYLGDDQLEDSVAALGELLTDAHR